MTSNEVQKWADEYMFRAEDSVAADGPQVQVLGAPRDPLGQIAACAKMYKGQVVRDTADVTNEERLEYLREIQKTVLKMPLEAVHLHFMVEGVTRGFTHQMVRQRTAAYAQESTRFAVKEDMKQATALPPSLVGTKSLQELVDYDLFTRNMIGLSVPGSEGWTKSADETDAWMDEFRHNLKVETLNSGGPQAWRLRWDEAVDAISAAYLANVNDGQPAEDARGLLPTNITTRLNYITNLRSFYDTMAVRVSDQAQFEWRMVAMKMALALRSFGKEQTYWTTISFWEYQSWSDTTSKFGPILQREFVGPVGQPGQEPDVRVLLSSAWQYEALTNEIKPIEFKVGRRAFGASFDRASRIGERVDAFAACGVPSDRWTQGAPEFNIPPINPEEWLFDPESARLKSDQEFDLWGNRVRKGQGVHWDAESRKVRWPNGDLRDLEEISNS